MREHPKVVRLAFHFDLIGNDHHQAEHSNLDAVALALNTMIEAKLKQRQTGPDGATPIE